MAFEWVRKFFAGGIPATRLSLAVDAAAVTLLLENPTNWPIPGVAPFVVVIDNGKVTEEKVLIGSRVGATLFVLVRGYDGTVAQAHAATAPIAHVLDAYTVDQANRLANLMTTKGQLIGFDGVNTVAIPAPGVDGRYLITDAAQPSGWSAVFLPAPPSPIPAGVIVSTIAAAADPGWLMIDGSTIVGAAAAYPALWAKVPATWKSGANLVMPYLGQRGLSGAGGGTALGGLAGSNTRTIDGTNLPWHGHTIDHDHPAQQTASNVAEHNHPFGAITGPPTDHYYGGAGDQHAHNAAYGGNFVTEYGGGSTAGIGPGTGYALSGSTQVSGSNHQHDLNGTTGLELISHFHTFDVSPFSGGSGGAGGGAAFDTTPAHMIVNYMIKT